MLKIEIVVTSTLENEEISLQDLGPAIEAFRDVAMQSGIVFNHANVAEVLTYIGLGSTYPNLPPEDAGAKVEAEEKYIWI